MFWIRATCTTHENACITAVFSFRSTSLTYRVHSLFLMPNILQQRCSKRRQHLQVCYHTITMCGLCHRNTSAFPVSQQTIDNFFSAPAVTVAEALGSPKKRCLSTEAVVNEVNIVVMSFNVTLCHKIFSSQHSAQRCITLNAQLSALCTNDLVDTTHAKLSATIVQPWLVC